MQEEDKGRRQILSFVRRKMDEINLKRYETQSVALSDAEQLLLGVLAVQADASASAIIRALMYKGLERYLEDGDLTSAHDRALELLTLAFSKVDQDSQLRAVKSLILSRRDKDDSVKRRKRQRLTQTG